MKQSIVGTDVEKKTPASMVNRNVYRNTLSEVILEACVKTENLQIFWVKSSTARINANKWINKILNVMSTKKGHHSAV